MAHHVTARNENGTALLVVKRTASSSQLSKVVPELCGVVWNFVKQAKVPSPGRNVAVHLNTAIGARSGTTIR